MNVLKHLILFNLTDLFCYIMSSKHLIFNSTGRTPMVVSFAKPTHVTALTSLTGLTEENKSLRLSLDDAKQTIQHLMATISKLNDKLSRCDCDEKLLLQRGTDLFLQSSEQTTTRRQADQIYIRTNYT